MSAKEWLDFHANPTVEALTPAICTVDFGYVCDCCSKVSQVFKKHFVGNAVQFVKRVKELGGRLSSDIEFDQKFYERKDCVEFLDALDPGLRHSRHLFNVVEHYNNGQSVGHVVFRLLDRHQDRFLDSPMLFVKTFYLSREWAKLGAIYILYALQKKYGKDVARMIARVVWSTRKYYLSYEMSTQDAIKRIKK